ncbi:MAG: gliding motility-associated C-terminal domain-containing protein [Crocinitomicaceae bacterium]|nr:gliding motility-associated C-terminal domain-containing protein [Crocinitomicaceae bacterium]
MRKLVLVCLFIITFFSDSFSQRGKDGNYTVSAPNSVVNTYTSLTANASVGNTYISVTSNALNGAGFSGNLAQGDLILIHQSQGVSHYQDYYDPSIFSLDIDWYAPFAYGSTAYAYGHASDPYKYAELYGRVLDYMNAGNYELREVLSISGTTTINLTCGLEKNYTASGHVQVIRIPRYQDLTINAGASVTSPNWNGTTGGIVSVEVNGNLQLNGSINVSSKGFRGGQLNGNSETGSNTAHTEGPGNGDSSLGLNNSTKGGATGESIVGYTTEYSSIYIGYGRGAVGNGGGGGGIQNAGGGGGANIGSQIGYTGKGIPTPGYATFWNTEKAGMATTLSAGGGRGGYSYANAQNYGVTPYVGPNNTGWGGNARKENGGYGGHPLQYDANRIFFGGGGGAGGQDSGQGGQGGNGGGIALLTVYGNVTGSGSIVANGEVGQSTNPLNQTVSSSNKRKGNDGAGGGGAGGYIYFKALNSLPSTISLQADGGNGGTVNLLYFTGAFSTEKPELTGPGAGGAGGAIAYTAGTPTNSISGGAPGGTQSNGGQNPMSANFPMNGATSGGTGMTDLVAPIFDIIAQNDTICGSQSGTLTATTVGTFPSGSTIGWYTSQFGGTPVATGTTYNTPVLSTTTTYYVGNCPGTFRKPVKVVVGQNPVISGTAVITDATCTTGGSISGLTVSGGTGTLTYDWNGNSATGPSISNASTGSYTLTVTDASGCSSQSGPYTINGVGGPVISGTPTITAQTCNSNGTITGLTVSASVSISSYSWSGTTTTNQDLSAPAGSYTLTVTDANGCTAQSGPYTIGTAPVPSISGTAVIINANCNNGGSITGLTASSGVGALTYSWNGTSSSTIDTTNAAAGSYTLTVTDANGCTAQSGPYQINTDANPVISGTAVVTDATCTTQGSITGLSASGVGTLTYEWNSTTSSTIDLSNAANGNYTLTVTDGNGCSTQSGPYTINITGGPTISGTPVITDETCLHTGSITGLIVTGGTGTITYSWNSTITSSADLTNAPAGSYTLYVADGNGCISQSGPYTINQIAAPVISGTPTIVDATCSQGGSISGLTVTGGAQPYSYSWNSGTYTTLDIANAPAGSYTLTLTDNNGCIVTSGPYTIGSQGAVGISGTAVVAAATCTTGGSITGLSASGGSAPYTYEWNGISNPTADISNLQPGTYTLLIEDNNGCTVTSVTYTVNAPNLPVIGAPTSVANASCVQGGSILGVTVTNGAGPYQYSWNNGQYTTADILNAPAGTYTLTVTDANGCQVTGNAITIGQDVLVDAQFSYSPDPVFINETVQFNDESIGAITSWEWHIDTNTTVIQHPTHTFTQAGTYDVTLIVNDVNGCIDSITVTIEVLSELEVPNVITVNGDGVNDLFEIKGLTPNTKVIILNRWGELIYSSDNYDNTWDGKDKSGKYVTEGVYTYLVVKEDGNKKHGFVHVVLNN